MRRGSVYQRHRRTCPRSEDGKLLAHKCRGPWSFNVEMSRRSDGSRRQITQSGFRTKNDAQNVLRDALAREEAGVDDAQWMCVGVYLNRWLDGKRSLRPKTVEGYRMDIDRYLIPQIGPIRLAELRPHHIDAMYSDLTKAASRPATPSTIRHVHTTLRSALNSAVRRRLLAWNPALHVELPEEQRPVTTVWTPQQVQAFLSFTAEHRLSALFQLIASAGLRRGEALGLHWIDVDLDGAAFTVRWQLLELSGGPCLGPPKTRSGARVVAIDDATVQALRKHREAQTAEQEAWENGWTNIGLAFTREDGTPLRPNYVSRQFASLAAGCSLPVIRLHDLRHTNASLALAAGVPLKVVSQRLGHSSTAITSNLYTHVIPAVARDAANRIGALIAIPSSHVAGPAPSAFLAHEAQSAPEETP